MKAALEIKNKEIKDLQKEVFELKKMIQQVLNEK